MNIIATIENACEGDDAPDPSSMRRWLSAALTHPGHHASIHDINVRDAELSIRLVDAAESQALNARYRQRNTPTNVLSFPADIPDYVELPLLGDIVICAPVVAREAREQHKTQEAHWAHMLVHGTLHLLGYDHANDTDAAIMEDLETKILKQLHYPPPYLPISELSVTEVQATDTGSKTPPAY